jgi:Mlc titration factor MtfA (ptsG expression regulator)
VSDAAILVLLACLAAPFVVYTAVTRIRRGRKRLAAVSAPFPDDWSAILRKTFPLYKRLPKDLRAQLEHYIQIFIAEKRFEGCGGLALEDEHRVTIAAQACLLLLNRPMDCYPKLRSVLVYPSTYVAGNKTLFGPKPDRASVRLGESWTAGTVVLAWDSVARGALNFRDGLNVAMHEFAHQLDQADGAADGAPTLQHRSAYSAWARVFSREYEALRRNLGKGRKSLLRSYGATNPAEFFAVATEVFFEKPRQMKRKHKELFEELKTFYCVDPGEWVR